MGNMCLNIFKWQLKFYITVLCLTLFNFLLIRSLMYNHTHVLSALSSSQIVVRRLKAPAENCNNEIKIPGNIGTMTIFTTFEYIESKYNANKNALMNWKSLKGFTNFVLFTNCDIASTLGKSLNYTVLPVMDTAIGGVPVLKTMYLTVLLMFPTTYVMFSNADILYDTVLSHTIAAVHEYVNENGRTTKPTVITGKRTNLEINSSRNETWENHLKKSQVIGSKFIADAQDYFIISKLFPWEKIPRFVIGRVGYDNWLVAFSRYKNFTVIDATESILAVHQTVSGINNEGFTHSNFSYNRDLIEKSLPPFQYGLWGRTDCCPLETRYDHCGQIYILDRSFLPPYCFHHYITYYIKQMLGF